VITAKSFTVNYDRQEDRIRLVLNYSDPLERLDLLLTRAMFLKLIPVLEQLLPDGARSIQNPLADPEPKAGYEATDAATMQLTDTPESLLVLKTEFQPVNDRSRVRVRFFARSQKTPDAESTMTIDALEQITGLILGAKAHTVRLQRHSGQRSRRNSLPTAFKTK
jgi:hypothetical protein